MTKLRKQRKRKTYRHNVNRKRLRNRIFSAGNLACKDIKNVWENKKSIETNLTEMGLSYDPNKTIKIPNSRRKFKASLLSNQNEWKEEIIPDQTTTQKGFIVDILEADAKAPRERKFRLPKNQVEWLTYLMRKYGENYKAMANDPKNYFQETWKQLRQKIRRFRSIPEQYNKFLEDNADFSVSLPEIISDDEI